MDLIKSIAIAASGLRSQSGRMRVISENIDGKRRTVWPLANRAAGTKPVWPVPGWAQRANN